MTFSKGQKAGVSHTLRTYSEHTLLYLMHLNLPPFLQDNSKYPGTQMRELTVSDLKVVTKSRTDFRKKKHEKNEQAGFAER